jgi:hypothetical protein
MGRLKKSVAFWAVLVAVVALLPTSLFATKAAYGTKIFSNGRAVGSTVIYVMLVNRRMQYNYAVSSFTLPSQAVQRVTLAPSDNSWSILLCETGGDTADDCAYTADGNLNDSGSIVPAMLMAAGITGAQFDSALTGGTLTIHLSDGVNNLGTGTYVQTYP